MGEAGAALGREIAGELNLLRQRQHIRIEPRAEQYLGRDIPGLAMGFGFGEQAGKRAERLDENGNGSVVKGHVMLFSWQGTVKCNSDSAAPGKNHL